MFKHAEPTYWEIVGQRAWAFTKDLFGWNAGTIGVGILCFVAALGVHAALRDSSEALDELVVTLIYLAPFVVATPIVFAVNVFRAVRALYEEQQEEIRRHEEALNAYSRKRDLGDRLVELRRQGVALRNRPLKKHKEPSLDGLEIAGWNREVDEWEARVLETIRGQVSAQDYGRFETLDTYTPKVFGWQINSEHGRLLSMLSRRIEILLEIMGNF